MGERRAESVRGIRGCKQSRGTGHPGHPAGPQRPRAHFRIRLSLPCSHHTPRWPLTKPRCCGVETSSRPSTWQNTVPLVGGDARGARPAALEGNAGGDVIWLQCLLPQKVPPSRPPAPLLSPPQPPPVHTPEVSAHVAVLHAHVAHPAVCHLVEVDAVPALLLLTASGDPSMLSISAAG